MKNQNKTLSLFIVDDDSMHSIALEKSIKDNHKCIVSTFSSGEECIENLHNNPDIIVLDYYLNSVKKDAMDGIKVLKKIKSEKPETEVIMLSSQEKLEIAKNTIKYGAYDYVVKSETALLKTSIIITNIIKKRSIQQNYESYKFHSRLLSAAIFFIVIFTLALGYYFPGLFNF